MINDELEQRLWELEYGLLSDDDAAELRAQIADDSVVGQLHDRVRAQLSLVAQAARIEGPRIAMRVPAGDSDSPFGVAPRPASSAPSAPISARIRRSASWCLGIATSLLFGLLGWSAWNTSTPELQVVANKTRDEVRPESLWIVVDAPSQLSKESASPIVVSTKSPDGIPQPAELWLSLAGKDGTNSTQVVTTDEQGRAMVELPRADNAAKLTFAYPNGYQAGLQVDLAAAETQYATHLRTDKPRYRPGDIVRYRSVTLSRFGLVADRDLTVEYQITDPTGQEVNGTQVSGTTEHGVGNGEMALSADAMAGQYTLFARCPEQAFPEVQHDFTVQLPTPRQYDIEVTWGDTAYEAGEQAQGKLAVRTPGGQPASDVKLDLRAYVDGRQVEFSKAEKVTDSAGNSVIDFGLPAEIAAGEGELGIKAGEQDVIWKPIPLRADQVQVDFYPEGGDLIGGVENRVYFYAHDFEGRAVSVRGRVIDAAEQVVSEVITQPDGRGAFRFAPQAGGTYELAIEDPPAIKSRPPLPAVVESGGLVLDAGAGVVNGDSPVSLKLRSRTPPAEFLVVASCRGVMVGQRAGNLAEFNDGVCEVTLPIVAEAAGVLRVTVFDYSRQPPEPLAERLVYRRPQQGLHLEWSGLLPKYAAGETVRGQVVTMDDVGRPVSAVLGISALDDKVRELARRPAPLMTTRFLLLGDVDRPEKLEDVNFYLSEDSEAAVALDLLLGTQGWRRFERMAASRLAGVDKESREGLTYRARGGFDADLGATSAGGAVAGKSIVDAKGLGFGRVVDVMDEAPRRFDNRLAVESLHERWEQQPGSAQSAPAIPQQAADRGWMPIVGFGLFVIVGISAVLVWHPTRTAALAGVSVAGVLVVLGLLVDSWTSPRREFADTSLSESAAGVESAGNLRSGVSLPTAPAESASSPAATASEMRLKSASELRAGPLSQQLNAPEAEMPRTDDPVPARAVVPPPPAAPSAAPAPSAGLAPTPQPIVPPSPAPKRMQEPVSRSAAIADPAVKLEKIQSNAQMPADTWRRASGRRLVEKSIEELLESRKPNGVALTPQQVADRPAEKGAGSGGAQKLDGRAGAKSAQEEAEMKSQRETQRLGRFPVRRYARTAVNDKSNRTADDYSETVYWDPLLVTDENGRANIEFVVPDTATQFRILAEGHHNGKLVDAEQTVQAEGKK